jgi:hypothetical protein
MRRTIPGIARAGLWLLPALAALSVFCAAPKPKAPATVADESETTRKATAACTNLARDRGLRILEFRSWTKTTPDKWNARLQVRAESGGLAYDMDCGYNPARDKVTLTRP